MNNPIYNKIYISKLLLDLMSKDIIKVFDYIPELDCFKPTEEYTKLAERLGITEWNPVVWIGRYFALDNDYGEHWFDNWDEREALEEKAKKHGYDSHNLLIVIPDRFKIKESKDGPVHSPEMRKQFWSDVLSSLELSLDTLFEEAKFWNGKRKKYNPPEFFISDLEERINSIKFEYSNK
jgi:hypothetical protein